MKFSDSYIETFGKQRVIITFGIIYFASQFIIGSILHEIGVKELLLLQTTLNLHTFKSIIQNWQTKGLMNVYVSHFYFDILHPIWYSIFLSSFLAFLIKKRKIEKFSSLLIVLPFVAGILDCVENIMHLFFLSRPKYITAPLVVLSGLSAILKWAIALISVILILLMGTIIRKK